MPRPGGGGPQASALPPFTAVEALLIQNVHQAPASAAAEEEPAEEAPAEEEPAEEEPAEEESAEEEVLGAPAHMSWVDESGALPGPSHSFGGVDSFEGMD